MLNKEIQLFVFPYAGGSVASFKRLTDLINPKIDVITVEYSGRGSRSKEPLAESISEMQDDAILFCKNKRDEKLPYAVMGYSMGCLLSYEMLVDSVLSGTLKHYFVAAEVSPQTRALELRKERNPSDEKILKRALGLGGLDERMINNKRFQDVYLRPMISDYRHFFEYQYVNREVKVKTDTSVFYSEEDTKLEDVQKWEEIIEGKFRYYKMGDNHFFINQYYTEMAEIINNTLLRNEYYDI